MKKKFIKPDITVVLLGGVDIVTASFTLFEITDGEDEINAGYFKDEF